MRRAWLRRSLTVPAMLLAALVWTALTPLALLAALPAARAASALRGAPHCVGLLLAFVWCEALGILASAWLWLRFGWCAAPGSARHERFLAANFRLQCRWARALAAAAQRLFGVSIELETADALAGGPCILMPRHASLGDTVLWILFYAAPCQRRLRYVLKRELLLDPCLDIVGNRLPNCFVDRFSDDPAREIAAVRALLRDLGDDSVLIYPEGTRFSPAKRERAIASLEARGELEGARRARALRHVLPPRLGGPLALLEANPGLDVVFCAHAGFDGASDLATLLRGGWLRHRIRVRCWRIPYEAIPRGADTRVAFLQAQWARMDATVGELQARGATP